MKRKVKLVTFFILLHVSILQGYECNLNSQSLQLISDYMTWRMMKSVVIIDTSLTKSCQSQALKSYFSCFSSCGLSLTFQTSLNFSKRIENFVNRKTGVAVFDTFSTEEVVKFVTNDIAWMVITNETEIVDKFRFTGLSLNADLVIAINMGYSRNKDAESQESLWDTSEFCNITCNGNDKIQKSINTQNTPTLYISDTDITEQFCNKTFSFDTYCFLQLYKIRKESNASVVVFPLGFWNSNNLTENLSPFLVTEKRLNFHKFQLKLGKQNATQNNIMDNVIEDNSSDENLIEISSYFQNFFNASIEIQYFEKLGRKENGKEWTDLLGAVVNEEVDLGLDTIIKTQDRYYDMAFSHNILTSMRNIYIKHQPSNELRDIYLIPFGSKLILFVVITGLILCIFMTLINKTTSKVTKTIKESKDNTLGEATIWCIGIFTMQGSVWTPTTCSGNIILITSLAFALVIFNSYSAFITSILSVELSSIRSVEDLLESNYNIGYVKNSQDEVYLRSMNDTQLQQIYLRGYLYNTVSNVSEGLYKSYDGHYGFFASTNVARKELQRINNYKCNYDIIEIPIMKTKNTIAFPLSKRSHYKKVIDLSIMRMYETGIYKYFYLMVVPNYPKCDERRTFRSAHLPDLSSAFGILIIGVQLSVIIIIGECLWKKKKRIYYKVKRNCFRKNFYHHRGQNRQDEGTRQLQHPYLN